MLKKHVPLNEKPYLTSIEVAQLFTTSPAVIKNSRNTGELFGRKAPEYIQVGTKKIVYEYKTLNDWIQSAPKMTVVGGGE